MANDAFRQLARAVFGRMRGVVSQALRSEAERVVRHFRERLASRAADPTALTSSAAQETPGETLGPEARPEPASSPSTQSPATQSPAQAPHPGDGPVQGTPAHPEPTAEIKPPSPAPSQPVPETAPRSSARPESPTAVARSSVAKSPDTKSPDTKSSVAKPRQPARAAAKAMSQEPAKTSSKTSSKSARIEASPGGAVDINAASRDALIALPHIGEARADAIIKGRPFKSLDELKDRKVLPASVIEALKGHISVG